MKFNFKQLPNEYNNNYKIEDDFIPVISIITPFYNSKDYIRETANSVLSQSFPWFEWLIIDDGSTDTESLQVLKEIEKLDKRIRVFHKENTGLASTRDFGCQKANKVSKYFLFLDDDDLIEKNYVECTFSALETNPDAAFAYTNIIGFGEQEYLWSPKFDIKKQLNSNQLVATALVRKSAYEAVGGYALKEKGINEDWIFWTKLFAKSYIPVRLDYFGFWYRRKKNGELKRSLNNTKKTQELLKPYVSKVDLNLKAIEYPIADYEWNDVNRPSKIFEEITPLKSSKKNIIFILPHIVMGGADKFCIDFLKGLDSKYSVTLILTNISENGWLQEIKPYVDNYYILPSFLERKYWHEFIEYLINKNNSKLIFNTNSIYGYMVLPYLKNKFPNIKIIDYVHMEEWYNRNGGYSRDSSAVSSVIDMTMTCNKNSERILKEYFGRQDNLKTVYIGVDEEYFNNDLNSQEIKAKYNIPEDKKIISYIARISYQKRPYLLLEIIKQYVKKRQDTIFLICGDGELLEDVKEKAKQEKILDYIRFLGSIKEPKEIYAISDATLNCSIKEGLALTTYESLSMGVPVISSDVGGQREIIDDKVGAVIPTKQEEQDIYDLEYDPEEISAFVTNLNRVIDEDNYKLNCRKRILKGFTIKQMNQNMNDIISTVLTKKTTKSFANLDIALELLNQYLLEDSETYEWLTSISKNELVEPNIYNKKQEKVIEVLKKIHVWDIYLKFDSKVLNIKKKLVKLHILKEAEAFGNIFKGIGYILIGIIIFIVYIIVFIVVVIKRIVNIIKKISS